MESEARSGRSFFWWQRRRSGDDNGSTGKRATLYTTFLVMLTPPVDAQSSLTVVSRVEIAERNRLLVGFGLHLPGLHEW